jgi:hypothetical protein
VTRLRCLAAAVAIAFLGACGGESGPVTETPALERPLPVVNVRVADGDGSVGSVVEGTLLALRENAYKCEETRVALRNDDDVVIRDYHVGSGRTGTNISITTRNGDSVQQSIHYTDRSGQRRVVIPSEMRPLSGRDSVANQIFAAASAAPCPTSSD